MKAMRIHENAILPSRATAGSAGYDLFALEELCIQPRTVVTCRTGIALEIPEQHYGRVAPKSSLALWGLDVLAGVIDSDYRGEIKILLTSVSNLDVFIQKGQACAQLILEKISTPDVIEANLSSTDRGQGGFGSTSK